MIKKLSILLCIPVLLFTSSCATEAKSSPKKVIPITPETALERYLDNGDTTYKWEVKESYPVGDVTAYDLLLTSQKWREHIWTHQLTVLVPTAIKYDGALLFITGGSSKGDLPNWKPNDHKSTKNFAAMAQKNKAMVVIIRQTPKQPLYDDLVEDQLISFTLHNFKKDKDYSWPLLFPMVKSAVKAMDAVQEFSKEKLNKDITRFTVSGASKRGWTTWLTGSQDKRVEAIAPMVIDVLNMPVSLDYQVEVWKEYSIQIEDYTKLEIPQTVNSPEGNAITQMIDPYSYRDKLTMPKLILIGTNDEYWPVDAIKNYINDIPGENYIHYVPNAGHGLGGGEQATRAISAFWEKTLDKKPYNDLVYQIASDKKSAILTVKTTSDELLNMYIWSADSDDRDFRDEKFISKIIPSEKNKEIKYEIQFPKKGYKAFYIDLEYSDPNGGKYTKSTRMYVADDDEVL
ncbi:MAG: PhoPQ-activated pathogenicity-related family protein [Flavobacteriaceae bacterium]|nr:PhoPQ-activated pathogenicity-related family protein [Flavobacteriaceae bacterium]